MPAKRWDDWVPPAVNPVNLEPLFPVASFEPGSACPHHGPIRDGSDFCCMVCSEASFAKDHVIGTTPAAPPMEPERRINKLIGAIASGELKGLAKRVALARIGQLDSLTHGKALPTSHVSHPTLKGGI